MEGGGAFWEIDTLCYMCTPSDISGGRMGQASKILLWALFCGCEISAKNDELLWENW